jgi:DNA-binding response OmpR family regulator
VSGARVVLIVEDEILIAMELEMTLRCAGYDVLGPALNVGAALELLQSKRPDAAVLDVDLAGAKVTPVAEVLRGMSVPFILASGYGAADLNADRVLCNAVNIGKPSAPALLLRELSGLLAGSNGN